MPGGNSQGNYTQDELGPAAPSAVMPEAMLSLACPLMFLSCFIHSIYS